jgi:hypothetical protein
MDYGHRPEARPIPGKALIHDHEAFTTFFGIKAFAIMARPEVVWSQ